MDKTYIYLVMELYDNGEYYEDHYKVDTVIHAFSTRSDAEQYILDMPVPTEDDELLGHYNEVTDNHDNDFGRVFQRMVRKGVYETLVYTISEIPYTA